MEEKSSKEKLITTQYAELNRFGANAEYERALKCANRSKYDFTAICFLKLWKYVCSSGTGASRISGFS